jgi:glucose-1-phosphate cytidylyltransferase
MKAIILAGGLGTRLSEETVLRPKPMVEIAGKPILWHIMKIYSSHGINDFIVCLGYKGYMIKEYFANYYLHTSDVTFDVANNAMEVHQSTAEPWKVTLADTGEETQTGGRLKRVRRYLQPGETFLLTYGDGVADVDVQALTDFHSGHGRLATVTAVQPPGRFGAMHMAGEGVGVTGFQEKPEDGGWINGGFFVLDERAIDYVEGDHTLWEREPMESLARDGQLAAYRHHGFWQAMDTLREKNHLESLWASDRAPWKRW